MQAFFREAGAGPGVVCLHSNASSSSQWRALMDALAPDFRVCAPDSYGAGKSPPWPAGVRASLAGEAALLEPVFALSGDPFVLVGHSYGAAIALVAAVMQPKRVRALALYEPTLFSLVEADSPPPNGADGIRDTVAAAVAALAKNDADAAARCFIDFWMGEGSWAKTPEARKGPIVASMANIANWGSALMGEPTPLQAFRRLDMPILYMTGKRSPESAQAVARLLKPVLPRLTAFEFERLGHMGPVTHPDEVNPVIVRFLSNLI